MSVSNRRIKEYNTVHHLTSRIAHQVYFLKDDERNDFLEFVIRVTKFSGIRLIGWCIMTNHFHLMVYLPEPEVLSDDEVRRRYDILKGDGASVRVNLGASDLEALRRRMYDIGNYMKMIKQWFSEDYNRRNCHKGTMWESAYHDSPVPMRTRDMAERLAYMHLNPIRAAITPEFSGYRWSSLTAFENNDAIASAGMRFVYGNEMTNDEMRTCHHEIMSELLESWKYRRATEIARKRAAGYEMPTDALTDEALVAQVSAQLDAVQKQVIEMHERKNDSANHANLRKSQIEDLIIAKLQLDGTLDALSLSELLQIPLRTTYRYLHYLQKKGVIYRESRTRPWQVIVGKTGQTSFAIV